MNSGLLQKSFWNKMNKTKFPRKVSIPARNQLALKEANLLINFIIFYKWSFSI